MLRLRGATTRQATGVVLNGRKRRRRLQDGRLSAAVQGAPPRASLPPRKHDSQCPLLSRWNWVRCGAMSSEEVGSSRPIPPNSQTYAQISHKGPQTAQSDSRREEGEATKGQDNSSHKAAVKPKKQQPQVKNLWRLSPRWCSFIPPLLHLKEYLTFLTNYTSTHAWS